MRARKTYSIDRGKLSVSAKPTLFNDPETKIYWQQVTKQTFIINRNNIYIVECNRAELALKFLVKYNEIGSHSYCSMYYGKAFNKLYLGTLNNGLNVLKLSDFHVAKKRKYPFPITFIMLPCHSVKIRSLRRMGLYLTKMGLSDGIRLEITTAIS